MRISDWSSDVCSSDLYKASRKTSGLILPTCFAVQCGLSLSIDALIVFSKVQAGVHRRDLLAVAVEWQSLDARGKKAIAYAAFGGLAPTWMRYIRVDVGVEAVFVGCDLGPTGNRHFFEQPDLDNGITRLEAVFQGNGHPQGRPVLIGQRGRMS